MKILVIDKYNHPRDLAQMDMYNLLNQKYDLTFANKENLFKLVNENNYDYFYLGIYHPWCDISNFDEIFKINKKPVIIDQADNEGFIARKYNYTYPENSILLSRYLPNENLINFWKGKLQLFPWYVNADRFIPQEKSIDIVFICMINIIRLGVDRKQMSLDVFNYCENNGLSHKIGQYFINYSDIITKAKAMVIDGSRYCLTQKYIEASLSNCLLIGQKPISPTNDFITIELETINSKNIDDFDDIVSFNRKYAIENFSNKDKFLENFQNIISLF